MSQVARRAGGKSGRCGARRSSKRGIVLDPGYGFGKRFGENYALLARQAELLELGRPLLAGLSRKSFLGHTLAPLFGGEPAPSHARETASLAAMTAAILTARRLCACMRCVPRSKPRASPMQSAPPSDNR